MLNGQGGGGCCLRMLLEQPRGFLGRGGGKRAMAEAVSKKQPNGAVRSVDDRGRVAADGLAWFGNRQCGAGGVVRAHCRDVAAGSGETGPRDSRPMRTRTAMAFAGSGVDQDFLRQPPDGTEPVATGAAGGIAIAQTGGDVGHAGAPVQGEHFDTCVATGLGAGQYLAAARRGAV